MEYFARQELQEREQRGRGAHVSLVKSRGCLLKGGRESAREGHMPREQTSAREAPLVVGRLKEADA